jgi:hypothetical protein
MKPHRCMRTPEIRRCATLKDYHFANGNRADARVGSMRLKVAFFDRDAFRASRIATSSTPLAALRKRSTIRITITAAPPAGIQRAEPDGANHRLACPALFAKIFSFPSDPNHLHICRRLVPLEGRLAIVTDAGRDAVDADVPITNGAEADGEAVWS